MRTESASPSIAGVLPIDDANCSSAPVFWIYLDVAGRWCLQGGATEASFASRAECFAFARDLAKNSSYRLFIETEDGRIVQELHDGSQIETDKASA
jgi:hypothetical protein